MICPKCQQEKSKLETLVAIKDGNRVSIIEAAYPTCKECLLKEFKLNHQKKPLQKKVRREWY